MRIRMLIIGCALALVAAACGSEAPTVERNFGVLDHGDQGALQKLAYNYQPDSTLRYGFAMDTRMHTDMDFPGLGGSGDMSMGMSMGGNLQYDVASGPQPGSTALTMRSDVSSFDLDHLTVDGQSMASELSAADLAALGDQSAIPEITVVVDELGGILELRSGDTALPTELFEGLGAGGFSDPTGMSLAGMFGPEMPADQVRVGAEWTVDNSQDIPFLGPLASSTHYWITGQEQYQGHDVLVIVSASTIDEVEIDLADMMASMLTMDSNALGEMGMSADDLAMMQSGLFADINMTMRFNYNDLKTTTYFDPSQGIVRWTSTQSLMTGSMEMDTPDGSGSMTFDMEMGLQMMLADDGLGA
ncbi:MAG: hypothetical protein HKN80_12170 [Acidimicrobiia bacterium]|nr:hypothetical protein [Acidimicrobiia bacterium]